MLVYWVGSTHQKWINMVVFSEPVLPVDVVVHSLDLWWSVVGQYRKKDQMNGVMTINFVAILVWIAGCPAQCHQDFHRRPRALSLLLLLQIFAQECLECLVSSDMCWVLLFIRIEQQAHDILWFCILVQSMTFDHLHAHATHLWPSWTKHCMTCLSLRMLWSIAL